MLHTSGRFLRGDRVRVTDSAGNLLERIVWAEGKSVVYLVSDRLFQRLLKGSSREFPIGFPKRDVVAADQASDKLICR